MNYTIGYANYKDSNELIKSLIKKGIKTLVDIRSIPFSRFFPQYNAPEIKKALKENGITYIGSRSMGIKDWKYYSDEKKEELVTKLINGNTIFMCCEKEISNCHRKDVASILTKHNTYGGDLKCSLSENDSPSAKGCVGEIPAPLQPTLF